MKVLVACEYSGRVRDAFSALGHDAWSCDLLPTESPGNHFQCDVLTILDQAWDLVIAHPSCTYLTLSAAWAFGDGPYHQKVKPGTLVGAARRAARQDAIDFVRKIWESPAPMIAIENPRGFLSTMWRPPTQEIQPYDFGDDASKATCLWLKGLPLLAGTQYVSPRIVNGKPRWSNQTDSGQNKLGPREGRAKERSLTYLGIAKAMAEQWGSDTASKFQLSAA